MERLWENIKLNLGRAYKSVRYGKKQYISFFIAVFLMQSFFWLLMLTQDAQIAQMRQNAEENYDYHISVSGMTQDQAIRLQNGSYVVFTNDKVYEIVRGDEIPTPYGGKTYTLYVSLVKESIDSKLRIFERKYLNPLRESASNPEQLRISYSPLLTLDDDIAALRAPYIGGALLFALVAVLVLMLLYNIRINHYKFMYGIYMSFGADYKKLLYTAAWELITVSLITLAPALVFSGIVRFVLAKLHGGLFWVSLGTIPFVFLLNIGIIFAAVALPMRFVSVRQPVDLLSAQDNANLVTSPRRSLNVFTRRFPRRYETVSLWRYRRYYAGLLLSSVVFAAISISVLYLTQTHNDRAEAPIISYTIERERGIDIDCPPLLLGTEGVEYLNYTYDLGSLPLRSAHLLIPSERVRPLAAFKYYVSSQVQGTAAEATEIEGYRATNYAQFTALDAGVVESLKKMAAASGGRITIEGDLDAVLSTPGTVVVTDSIYNAQRFTIMPGDKLQLALHTRSARPIDANISKNKEVLRQQLRWYDFAYTDLTVGAVIRGMPAEKNIVLGLSVPDCAAILGEDPKITKLEIVTDPTLDFAGQTALDTQLEAIFAVFDDCAVTEHNVYEARDLSARAGTGTLLIVVSAMILVFFPLVCFFSQLLFYSKREKEFLLLRALGAVDSEIRRIHRVDGLLLSAANFFLSLGMSFFFNWIVYMCCNSWLPALSILDGSVRHTFTISSAMLIVALIISLLCGFLSAEIPYHRFIARQKRLSSRADNL